MEHGIQPDRISSIVVTCNVQIITGKLSFKVGSGGGDEPRVRQQEAGHVAEAADDVSAQRPHGRMLVSVYLHHRRRHTLTCAHVSLNLVQNIRAGWTGGSGIMTA